MNRRDLVRFQDPVVKQEYFDKYGDPLDDVAPQDLMDLMENLWASTSGPYSQLKTTLVKKGMDPWSVRQELAEHYFRNMYIRNHKLDEEADKSRIQDVTGFIGCRIADLIRAHQAQEAADSEHIRDRFGPRIRL